MIQKETPRAGEAGCDAAVLMINTLLAQWNQNEGNEYLRPLCNIQIAEINTKGFLVIFKLRKSIP